MRPVRDQNRGRCDLLTGTVRGPLWLRHQPRCETSKPGPMPFGNSAPSRKRTARLKKRRFFNPKGIVPSSPGLRGTSYPGSRPDGFSTPTGLRHVPTSGSHPRWGCWPSARFPRVARASQPWAGGHNPLYVDFHLPCLAQAKREDGAAIPPAGGMAAARAGT